MITLLFNVLLDKGCVIKSSYSFPKADKYYFLGNIYHLGDGIVWVSHFNAIISKLLKYFPPRCTNFGLISQLCPKNMNTVVIWLVDNRHSPWT